MLQVRTLSGSHVAGTYVVWVSCCRYVCCLGLMLQVRTLSGSHVAGIIQFVRTCDIMLLLLPQRMFRDNYSSQKFKSLRNSRDYTRSLNLTIIKLTIVIENCNHYLNLAIWQVFLSALSLI
jgi:hypothetical protein